MFAAAIWDMGQLLRKSIIHEQGRVWLNELATKMFCRYVHLTTVLATILVFMQHPRRDNKFTAQKQNYSSKPKKK
ncbi:hypothetical protein APT95_16910 [Providencia stuartii]|nr:hypothetical protein APT95_16910 [Providencia stuartii]